MPKVSQRVLDYARNHFRSSLEELLDDPSWLLHPDEARTPREYFAERRLLAAELGFDFDKLIDEMGTDYERQRLRDMMTK